MLKVDKEDVEPRVRARIGGMSKPDRLTALDTSFLHLEHGGAHMHVASVMVFAGEPPSYEELEASVGERLHLVPRYRQKLCFVPLQQGRPVWVDDPYFNLRYHVRHSALPAPGSDEQLKRLAGRLFALELDREKPLWEIHLVEGLAPGPQGEPRFALIGKTHHALVDGVSGVDITAVLFDASPDPVPVGPPGRTWTPTPTPSAPQLLADALVERLTVPREAVRGVRSAIRGPRRALGALMGPAAGVAAMARASLSPAPASPFNVQIGPHRRYTWIDLELARMKAIKNALGGTLNDAVLAAVSLGVGRWMRAQGHATEDLELRVMVPVSVRADVERGALGNRVSAVYAPLPVHLDDAVETFARVHEAMGDLKGSGQAVGATTLTALADFAPTTILSQAARLQTRQRMFNFVVTNVPGPQVPLFVAGRRLVGLYPVVPLARNTALGIAIMSYDGHLAMGLLGDYDAMPELDALGEELALAVDDLERAAAPARPSRARRTGPRLRPRDPAAT
jgi:WS/DGAT/MGAT family acyltransferase